MFGARVLKDALRKRVGARQMHYDVSELEKWAADNAKRQPTYFYESVSFAPTRTYGPYHKYSKYHSIVYTAALYAGYFVVFGGVAALTVGEHKLAGPTFFDEGGDKYGHRIMDFQTDKVADKYLAELSPAKVEALGINNKP